MTEQEEIAQAIGKTISNAIKTVSKYKGKPVVIQAMKEDADIGISVVLDERSWLERLTSKTPNYVEKNIICIGFCEGQTTVVARIGQTLSKYYDVPFWFPSPDEPDEDSPSWLNRNKAINCADCQKLIIPTEYPHLSKEVCYRCHHKREEKADFMSDKKEHYSLQLHKISPKASIDDYSSYTKIDGSFGNGNIDNAELYNDLKSIFVNQEVSLGNDGFCFHLYENDINDFYDIYSKRFYEQELPRYHKISEQYQPTEQDKQENLIITVEFAGYTYQLHRLLYREFIRCIKKLRMLQEVLDNQNYLLVFFRHNTKKMDLFMYFIRNSEQKTMQAVIKHFAELSAEEQKTRVALTEEQSRNVLQRLVQAGYIEIDAEENISITFKGMFY